MLQSFFQEQDIQNRDEGTGKRYLKNVQKKYLTFGKVDENTFFSDSERE